MSLYKYVVAERIDILRNGRIRFSQASALNDPIEVHPVFDDLTDVRSLITDENIRGQTIQINHKILNPSGDGHLTYQRIFHLGKGDEEFKRFQAYMVELVGQISVAFGESIGVLSLTEKPDNLLMWAHYAQQHQGFVIEFDERHSFFKQNESEELGRLSKMTYSIDRPRRASMVELTAQEFFLTKGKDWEYEQEWRMPRLLSDSDIKVPIPTGVVHLFSIPAECISGLILGCRMSEQAKADIKTLLIKDERYQHIKIYRAEIDFKKYQLNIVPV